MQIEAESDKDIAADSHSLAGRSIDTRRLNGARLALCTSLIAHNATDAIRRYVTHDSSSVM